MNKRKLLARGVILGYAAIGTQMFYSFASIPLALSHLSNAEFGMWGLISTVTMFLNLAELGITNAFTRHLFDYKDGKDPLRYGRLFTASALSLGAVAVVILLVGLLIAFFSAPWLRIPTDLTNTYVKLMIGQVLISATTMATRMLAAPLYIHHRQDLNQISQIGLFVIWYAALYFAFNAGWGIYSMLANQAAGFLWVVPFYIFQCSKNGFYPAKGTWGLPDRLEWLSVMRYSRDQFIIHICGLFLMGLPQLLISRLLGLDAAAVWAVCSRPFAILRQIVTRPFDVALPMLTEQFVRGEMKKVTKRWIDLSQLVLCVSGCVFAVAAVNNNQFVSLWTHGKIHWDATNDWMLALYFYVYVTANLSFGIIGLSKHFGGTRFIPLFQVIGTLVITIPLAKLWGVPGLILGMTLPFVFGMILFGVHHLGSITGEKSRPIALHGLLRPTGALPLTVFAAWACSHLNHLLPGYFGLILSAGTGLVLALASSVFVSVSREVRSEMAGMLSRPFRRIMAARHTASASVGDIKPD